MRISDASKSLRALDNIYQNSESLDEILNKLSSGKNITKAHEDPVIAQRAMFFRNIQSENGQYIRNGNDAKSLIDFTESALNNVGTLLDRVKELSTTAANGSLNNESREALGQELNQIIAELTNIGNQNFNGKYIFAGHRVTDKPFTLTGDPPASVSFNGDNGALKYQLSGSSFVGVNIDGGTLFSSIISDSISLRDNIMSGNIDAISSTDITNVDKNIDAVLASRTELGAKSQIVDYTLNRLTDNNIKTEEMLSGTEDLDMAKAITDMQLKENSYKTSLSIISKIQSMSLADFMK